MGKSREEGMGGAKGAGGGGSLGDSRLLSSKQASIKFFVSQRIFVVAVSSDKPSDLSPFGDI